MQNRNKNMNRRLIEMLLYGEKIQAEIDGYTELEIPKKNTKGDNFKDYLKTYSS